MDTPNRRKMWGASMSKTILATLLAAVFLIVIATIFQSTFVAGSTGLVLMVGLIYSYVVAKREADEGGEAG